MYTDQNAHVREQTVAVNTAMITSPRQLGYTGTKFAKMNIETNVDGK